MKQSEYLDCEIPKIPHAYSEEAFMESADDDGGFDE